MPINMGSRCFSKLWLSHVYQNAIVQTPSDAKTELAGFIRYKITASRDFIVVDGLSRHRFLIGQNIVSDQHVRHLQSKKCECPTH